MEDEIENDNNGMEFKCVSLAGFKALDSEGEGVIESIVSVTGVVDNVRDVIAPGAYKKSLDTRTPKGVWHHDWKESVSKTLDIKELLPGDPELPATLPNGKPWPDGAGALKVKTQFNLGTQRGREAYSDVVFFGDQQEWSIGYNVPVGGASRNTKSGIRTITKLDLYEYSPVLFGAMPAARTASVKDAQLAYKSLMGEVVADEDNDEIEEKAEIFPNDGSNRVYGFLEDGVFTKAQASVSSAQSKKIHNAIMALVGLLRETNVVDDDVDSSGDDSSSSDAGDDASSDTSDDGSDDADTGDAGGDDADNGSDDASGSSMATLVGDSFEGDDEMADAGKQFDEAIQNKDSDELQTACVSILDAIDKEVDDNNTDPSNFSQIGMLIQTALENANSWPHPDDDDSDDSDDSGDDSDSSDDTGDGSKMLTIDANEIKALLS